MAGSATPRPESVHALRRVRLPARVDGRPLPPVQIVDMREQPRRPAPRHEPCARRRAQGDRPAQPPRLVELRRLPLLRARLDVPAVRRLARPAPRRRTTSPAITAVTASACPQRCTKCGSVSVARHGAGTERLEHDLAQVGHEVFRLDADVRDAGRAAAPLRAGAARHPAGHADGRQGPRLPRRHARRGRRRRRHAALPRLPRRGADVRARHPARRPRRPRSRRRARDRPDAGARRRLDRGGRAPRRRRLPRRRARAARGAALSAVLPSHPDRLLGARPARRRRRRDRGPRRARRHPGRDGPRPRAALSPARARARPARHQGRRTAPRPCAPRAPR